MERQFSIIPKPARIKLEEGFYRCTGFPAIKSDDFQDEIKIFTEQMRGNFNETAAPIFFRKLNNSADESWPTELYRINIQKERITLEASTPKGAYHGLQTIRQLFLSEFKNGELILPCAKITDYPRFPWRGFMLDCSRHFYSVPFVKNTIDIISMHHMSRFHWHLTDDQGWRLPVKEYPLLTEIGSRRQDLRRQWVSYVGGFYTEEEIQEIVEYAAKRHIEVVPEVDLPGHASAILASYPGLGCTGGPYRVEDRHGIFEDVLCAGNDQIFDLAEKIINTVARLFPSKWVHIGGDEVKFNRWENCPKCQKRLEQLGLEKTPELQSWITHKLVQLLAGHGKVAIGWDEILEDSKKFILPKETVVMSWRGSNGGIRASGLGHKVIMSPNTEGCYLDYKNFNSYDEPGQTFLKEATVYKAYFMDPVTPEMSEKDAANILGGQGNLWSELIYAGKIAEYMIFPRLCAIAEAVWSPREGKDFEDFSARLAVHRKRLDSLGINQYRGPLK